MWLSEEGKIKYKNLKFSFKLTKNRIAEAHIVLRVRVLCLWSGFQHHPHPIGMLLSPLKKALAVIGTIL